MRGPEAAQHWGCAYVSLTLTFAQPQTTPSVNQLVVLRPRLCKPHLLCQLFLVRICSLWALGVTGRLVPQKGLAPSPVDSLFLEHHLHGWLLCQSGERFLLLLQEPHPFWNHLQNHLSLPQISSTRESSTLLESPRAQSPGVGALRSQHRWQRLGSPNNYQDAWIPCTFISLGVQLFSNKHDVGSVIH